MPSLENWHTYIENKVVKRVTIFPLAVCLLAGERTTLLQFSDLSPGQHSYTISVTDIYGFSGSNQLSFTTESKKKTNFIIITLLQFSQEEFEISLLSAEILTGTCDFYLSSTDTLSLMCRGVLKLGSSTYSVTCDSDKLLNYADCVLRGQPVPCQFYAIACSVLVHTGCISSYYLHTQGFLFILAHTHTVFCNTIFSDCTYII